LTDIVRTAPAATPLIGQAADPAALTQALETLMHFGALMLRAVSDRRAARSTC
jgi:hypothetical protein